VRPRSDAQTERASARPAFTLLLGALLVAATTTNVLLLNLSYDVPVKLYSVHLLVMALFLAAPMACG
jgi:hypothetical protein